MKRCPKVVAIEMAEIHSKAYTKSRHFGCVAWDKKRNQPIFMGSNHPDFHAEALFLDEMKNGYLKSEQENEEQENEVDGKDRY